MKVIKGVLKTEGVANGQLPIFCKSLQRLCRLRRPAAAARNHEGALGSQQHFTQLAQAARVAPSLNRLQFWQGLGTDLMRQHVFRQDQHHRTWPSIHGCGKSTCHVFRNALGIVNALNTLGHAFGAGAKERTKVDFLKSFAISRLGGHIAHKQNHGGRVLERRMNANRGIGSARSTCYKTNAWTAR